MASIKEASSRDIQSSTCCTLSYGADVFSTSHNKDHLEKFTQRWNDRLMQNKTTEVLDDQPQWNGQHHWQCEQPTKNWALKHATKLFDGAMVEGVECQSLGLIVMYLPCCCELITCTAFKATIVVYSIKELSWNTKLPKEIASRINKLGWNGYPKLTFLAFDVSPNFSKLKSTTLSFSVPWYNTLSSCPRSKVTFIMAKLQKMNLNRIVVLLALKRTH